MVDVVQDGHLIAVHNPEAQNGTNVPDTPIAITPSTTVVVQTEQPSVRYYALEFRTHLYNGSKKVKGWVSFIKGRFSEKSTYVFLGAGVAAASALPSPWSFISMGLSVVAAMVPDHVINDDGSRS